MEDLFAGLEAKGTILKNLYSEDVQLVVHLAFAGRMGVEALSK